MAHRALVIFFTAAAAENHIAAGLVVIRAVGEAFAVTILIAAAAERLIASAMVRSAAIGTNDYVFIGVKIFIADGTFTAYIIHLSYSYSYELITFCIIISNAIGLCKLFSYT